MSNVDLVEVSEMLEQLQVLRKRIMSGRVRSWYALVVDDKGQEETYSGTGKIPVRALLKMSAARMACDDPPLRQAGKK